MTVLLSTHSPARSRRALDLHWTGPHGERPLPLRVIRSCRSRPTRRLPAIFQPELRHLNSHAGTPFNLTLHLRNLCADIVAHCPSFHHIDMERVLVSITRSRSGRAAGLVAKVTPMRFRGGELIRTRRKHAYRIQRFWLDGVEVLYLVTFCVPRFLNQTFDEKMITIFHELYHIAPEFNGDLRRHGGRYCIHTRSQKGYDRRMAGLAREYLLARPAPELHDWLRLDFTQLRERHTGVIGMIAPVPKLVLLEE